MEKRKWRKINIELRGIRFESKEEGGNYTRSVTYTPWIAGATRALFNRAETASRRGILRGREGRGWTQGVEKEKKGKRSKETGRERIGSGEGKGKGMRGLVVPRPKGWMDGCECNCLIGETVYAYRRNCSSRSPSITPRSRERRCPFYVPSFQPLTGRRVPNWIRDRSNRFCHPRYK